jgi:hypothetical protein
MVRFPASKSYSLNPFSQKNLELSSLTPLCRPNLVPEALSSETNVCQWKLILQAPF